MSRVQLALNVSNLEASIEFYSKMFGTTPHKLRPGYANFSISEPPLKLVLIETPDDVRGNGAAGALNHLGVEVDSIDDVNAAAIRLTEQGMSTLEERGTDCCYAIQDKVWVHDPAGAPWEFYTVTDDNPTGTSTLISMKLAETGGACCAPGQC